MQGASGSREQLCGSQCCDSPGDQASHWAPSLARGLWEGLGDGISLLSSPLLCLYTSVLSWKIGAKVL